MTPRSREVFAADWLAMREPIDHASRAPALLPLLAAAARAGRWSRLLDLGCGTGSNVRYLAPRLPKGQQWTIVDRDAALLAQVEIPDRVQSLQRVCGDLAREGIAGVGESHLVTGSALLDLVSETWLRALAEACRDAACGVLFAMTYDGHVEWDGGDAVGQDPDDEIVRQAVNTHQTRDKGLGPALGPSAGAVAQSCFREAGYRTWFRPSPWHLGETEMALALTLVDGWERAAVEERPELRREVAAWARRRRDQLNRQAVHLTVGHVDMLALPVDSP